MATTMFRRAATTIGLLTLAMPAAAAQATFVDAAPDTTLHGRLIANLSFVPAPDGPTIDFASPQAAAQAAPSQRPVVFEYSEGYQTRLKIHKIASLATIPLFVAEGVVGQELYNNPTAGKRTAHLWIATGIGVLFGLNTVTGVWNLNESRKDPNGRARRLTHSILMLAADAGFFATAVTGPGHHQRDPNQYDSQRSLHRTLAFTSVTLASVGYGIMFVWPH